MMGQVIQAVAGEVYLMCTPPQVFLAEVLGHLASSEGYPFILYRWGRIQPSILRDLKAAIPAYFGTMVTPVNFSDACGSKVNISAIGERVVLCSKFPFKDFQLSSDYQLMEFYGVMELLQLGRRAHGPTGPLERRQCRWVISKDTCVEGLACYLVYGGREHGPYEHTNASLPGASTAWENVIIPISVRCESGDVLVCDIDCHVYEEPSPSYNFTYKVERGGCPVEELTGHISFNYADILSDLVDLRDLYK